MENIRETLLRVNEIIFMAKDKKIATTKDLDRWQMLVQELTMWSFVRPTVSKTIRLVDNKIIVDKVEREVDPARAAFIEVWIKAYADE